MIRLSNIWKRLGRGLGIREAHEVLEQAQSGGLERETALRHRSAIELSLSELRSSRASLADGLPLELVAEHVRRACDALDAVSGATTAEDVLDRIFARFCLGK